jgi:hypothetical protein
VSGLIDWASPTRPTWPTTGSLHYEWYQRDQRVVYEHHKRFLQHLQFRNPGEWVLKWPKHLFGLDALLETYPDARIVWTHRDPARVVPSAVSFVGTLRAMNSPVFDPRRFGAEWSALEEMGLHRGLEVRDRVGDERFLDVQYNDLITDPVAAVTRVYQHFGLPADDETIRRLGDSQEENPQAKHAPRVHPRAVRLRAGAATASSRGPHRALPRRARPAAAQRRSLASEEDQS